MATPRVRSAIAASPKELAPSLPLSTSLKDDGTRPYNLQLVTADQLSSHTRDIFYDLWNENISPMSKHSSMKYTEASKRTEMFDPQGRYIIASTSTLTLSTPLSPSLGQGILPSTMFSNSGKKGKRKANSSELNQVDITREDLLGYCSFRFETEETLGPKDAEIVYCYELQLVPSARGMGLGKVLINIMEEIGSKRGMEKAMLTVLNCNQAAYKFYTKQGYTPDEIDPTRMSEEEEVEGTYEDEDEDEADDGGDSSDGDDGSSGDEGGGRATIDYRILSKSLQKGR